MSKEKEKDNSISPKKFKEAFLNGDVSGYVKKPNSWKKHYIWWENYKRKWFINIAEDVRIKSKGKEISDSCLITLNDLDQRLRIWKKHKFKFYLDE